MAGVTLPTIDLTGAAIGATAKHDISTMWQGAATSKVAILQVFNDSGAGLQYSYSNGGGGFLPAGGWRNIPIHMGVQTITYTVIYTLPNPPVSILLATFYLPNEPVPDVGQLGNSPVGVGGSVNTSNVQTLSQEGAASPLLTIDIGDATFSQLITIYNDGHGLWAIDQSGVKHQVFKFNLAGNPLQLGQAGDTVEVLGQLLVDQLLTDAAAANALSVTNNASVGGTLGVTGDATFNGASTGLAVTNNETVGGTLGVTGLTTATGGVLLPNSVAIESKDAGGTVRNLLLEDGSDQVKLQAGGANNVLIVDNAGTTLAVFDGTGLNLPTLPLEMAGVVVLSKGANTHLAAPGGAQILFDVGGVNVAIIDGTAVQAPNGVNYNIGRIKDINNGSNLSGTINHGLSGTPAAVVNTCNSAGGSATVGAYSYTSTQFGMTIGSSLNGRWVAYR